MFALLPNSLTGNLPLTVKDAMPAITVMLVNGGLNFLAAILILIIGWTIATWASRWTRRGLDRLRYLDPTLKPLLASTLRYVILALTVMAVLARFGVQTTSVIALLGAAGIAVGLALQGTLSNVASGVMLLVLRPFRVYEKIVAGGVKGMVREIGLFRTIITTDDGIYVSIPNATLFSATIVNNSRETTRRTSFTVDIDHSANIDVAQAAILKAVSADSRVLKMPPPDVLVSALSGGATTLSILVWAKNSEFGGLQSDLLKAVRHCLQSAAVRPPRQLVHVGMPQPAQEDNRKSA